MKRNIKLVLEYDGTNFIGWQIQAVGRSIQKTLQDVIGTILNHPVRLTCAGRTDSGVHALGQVVNFHTDNPIPLNRLIKAINSYVRPEISAISAEDVPESFNARRHAKLRWYRYRILTSTVPHVFEYKTSYFYPHKLDYKKMELAGYYLLGTHDFTVFNASPHLTPDSIRTMTCFNLTHSGSLLIIDLKAHAFLHHMVRSIIGTLIEIGRDKMDVEDIRKIIDAKDRKRVGYTVPPQGLFLMQVDY